MLIYLFCSHHPFSLVLVCFSQTVENVCYPLIYSRYPAFNSTVLSPGHPKSPRPVSDSQGRSALRQIPTESIRAGLWGRGCSKVQERKRKRVISRVHGHRHDKIEMRELFSLVSLRSHPAARQPIWSTRVNQHVRSEVKITRLC